ncbi:MAG: HEAT repeat domain-containing protein, partial [Armatimonadota bacterium]
DAAKLIDLATSAQDDATAAAALKAAAACAAHNTDAAGRSAPFVAALGNAKGPRRTMIEKSVAKIGGPDALKIVVADLQSEDKSVRKGALEALAEWQDFAAVAPLLEAAKSTDADQQATALRGLAQLLRASTGMPAADKSAAYQQALKSANRPEDLKMLLGALATERGQEYFNVATSYLDSDNVKPEASLAVIKIALPKPKGIPGLKGAKVLEGLKQAIPTCPDGGLKADAQRYLKTLEGK